MGSRGSRVLARSHEGVLLGIFLVVEEKEALVHIVPWDSSQLTGS